MVRAAASAGFDFVGVRPLNCQPGARSTPLLESPALRRETLGLRDNRGQGARCERRASSPSRTAGLYPFFEAAAELGTRHVLATGDDADESRIADRFATWCDVAHDMG